MQVRVLGNAQDGGVPHLGCSCEVCERARTDPAKQKYASSLLLTGDSTRYLIDPTPDIRFQLRGDAIDGVFLSHEHLGHLPGLLYFGTEALDTAQLPVYCTPQLAAFIRTNEPFVQLVDRGQITLTTIQPGSTVDIAGGAVDVYEVPHRTVHAETLAYQVRDDRMLLYLSDVDAWTEHSRELVTAADIALVDGCFWDPDELDRFEEVPHPAITHSMDVLDPAETDIYFTHLNHTNPVLEPESEERQQVEARGFHVAEQGETFSLG